MRQRIFITLGIAAVALVAATAAFGAVIAPVATVTGTAGIGLNLPGNPTISDTLDGTDQSVNYSALLGVVDARGTGFGWNLQIDASAFSDGPGPGAHSFAPGAITAPKAAVAATSATAAIPSVMKIRCLMLYVLLGRVGRA